MILWFISFTLNFEECPIWSYGSCSYWQR